MQPETIANRYRVVRAIGRGGMGTVWLCEDQVLSRQVAVKQIRPPEGESRADTARAMREARVAAALNHRNAVSIFDVVEQDDATWLVMEYVPSQTLAEIITAEGSLPPTRVAYIGAQVADALASAHALGIVHRDIKPGNVLVGENDLAKISDFGIARGHLDLSLTQTGMMTGTPAYFSPELARGEEPDSASDVWALGVTLYSATEGGPPYPTLGNPLAMLSAIVREPTPPPTQAGPLTDTLAAMLDRDPETRATMEQARGWLHEVAERGSSVGPSQTQQFPVVAVPPPQQTSPQETPSPEPGTAAASYGEADPPTPVSSWSHDGAAWPPDEEDHSSRGRWLAAAVALLILLGAGWLLYSTLGVGDDPNAGNAPGAVGDTSTTPSDSTTSQQTKPTKQQTTESSTEPTTPTETTESTTPTETTESTEQETTTTTSRTPPAAPATSETDFVASYFAVLPEDLDAGWAQLSPQFQAETGRGSYDAFWGSMDDVQVSSITPLGDGVVNYEVTYFPSGGDPSTEQKQLQLVPSGDSYLIDGDSPA